MTTHKEELLGLLRKAQEERVEQPDLGKLRDDWQAAVDALLSSIERWLADATGEGLLAVERAEVEIDEEMLGNYVVPGLVIRAPNGRSVTVTPKARIIIGGQGRVDLTSGAKRATLVLDDGRWSLIARRPRVERTVLTEEVFDQMLAELLR